MLKFSDFSKVIQGRSGDTRGPWTLMGCAAPRDFWVLRFCSIFVTQIHPAARCQQPLIHVDLLISRCTQILPKTGRGSICLQSFLCNGGPGSHTNIYRNISPVINPFQCPESDLVLGMVWSWGEKFAVPKIKNLG